MTMRPEASLPECDRLAAWLAIQTSEGTLPAVWTSHVSECLSCYRFWTEWRDRPQQEAQLRAVLVDGQVDIDIDGAGLDLDDAFWRQLPGRVYQEVMAPVAALASTPAQKGAGTKKPSKKTGAGITSPEPSQEADKNLSRLLARFWPASWRRASGRASLPAWQHPFFAACTGVALGACLVLGWQSHRADRAIDNFAARAHANDGSLVSSTDNLSDDAPSPGEGSGWLGALAELQPTELAALLRSQDESGSSFETADETFQELTNAWTDSWADAADDALGEHFGSKDGGRSSRQVRPTRRP